MPIKNCITNIPENLLSKEQKDNFIAKIDSYVKKGMDERDAGIEVIKEFHKTLHDDLNSLKKEIGVKQEKYVPFDSSKNIKSIQDKYSKLIEDETKAQTEKLRSKEDERIAADNEHITSKESSTSKEVVSETIRAAGEGEKVGSGVGGDVEAKKVEDVGNFTADISDAKNNIEDKVVSIDANMKKYGVTNDASKSLIKRAIEKVDGLSVNNVFDLAEKIAKNDNKPIRIEHIAEAINYEVGRTEAGKDAFNISLDDIKETMLSQNKEYYPANKERMEEIGITEKSYTERKNKLKKIKSDYESLPDKAKAVVKIFITRFEDTIKEDAKLSPDEYLELLGGVVKGKEIEDIAENVSNAIRIIEDKEAIQLKGLPKVESPLLNRDNTEEALKRFTSKELKNIPVFNKAKVEQMIADGLKKNKEVRLNTQFAELYNLPDKVKVIVLNKDNTVSFLDKNDKPIKGVSLSKSEFVDLALKMGNAQHKSAYEISRLYHEAKADKSNPELVKAVEEAIGKPTEQKQSVLKEGENKKVGNDKSVETGKAVMEGVFTDHIENGEGDEVSLPENGYLIDGVYLKEGAEKGKGHGQELYKKALDEHGVLYSSFPVSEDALRVQEKLVEKGFAKIDHVTLKDGTELRKITKIPNKETVVSDKVSGVSSMDNFDWNSIYTETPQDKTASELIQKQKEQKVSHINDIKSNIDNKIKEAEKQIEDWQSRKYKSNEDVVYKGGDDIHGEGMSIGAINEGKRQKKIRGFQSEIESLNKAKEILSNYDLNREGDILDNIRKDFKQEDYIRKGKKMSTNDRIILDDAYDKVISYLKESPTPQPLQGKEQPISKTKKGDEVGIGDVEVKKSGNAMSGNIKFTFKLGDANAVVLDYGEPMGVEGMPSWAKKEHYVENLWRNKQNEKSKGFGLNVILKILQNAKENGADIVTGKMREDRGGKLHDYYKSLGFKDIGKEEPDGVYIDLRTNKPIEYIQKLISDKSKDQTQIKTKKGDEVIPSIENKSDVAKKYAQSLNEYESDGYQVTQLREAKEAMIANPEKTALAMDIRDFARKIWGKIFSDKTPLAELRNFFYSDATSVKDWAEQQINGIKEEIVSDQKYIDSIKDKKKLTVSDKKSIEIFEDKISGKNKEIEKINSELSNKENKPTEVKQGGSNAVQKQSAAESLLRNEGIRGESGLPKVEQDNKSEKPAEESKPQKEIKQQGKDLADKIRALRPKKGDTLQATIFALPIAIYDTAIVTIANAVEAGATLADAINEGVKYIRSQVSNWQDKDGKFAQHIHDIADGKKPTITARTTSRDVAKPQVSETATLDDLVNDIVGVGEVKKYLSRHTIEKHTDELPTNPQEYISTDLEKAFDEGENIIEKAKSTFGEKYVPQLLDYLNKAKISNAAKSLIYVSLANDLYKEKKSNPDRFEEITKLQFAVNRDAQAFAHDVSIALGLRRLQNLQLYGYDTSYVPKNILTPTEAEKRNELEDAIEVDDKQVNVEYEEQVTKPEEKNTETAETAKAVEEDKKEKKESKDKRKKSSKDQWKAVTVDADALKQKMEEIKNKINKLDC